MPVPLYRAKADFFRALGHPARIRLLELLADGDKPVHQLREAIDIEASSLSHQLAVLRQHGLVDQRREILQSRTVDQSELVDELSRPGGTT